MRKKSGGGNAVIFVGATIVVFAGIAFAFTQDWKTGRNGLVDYARAEMGDAEMQYQLGQNELKGKTLTSGAKTAIVWFEKSAKNGHVPAMMTLADMYNTSPDRRAGDLACHWYEEAAKAGNLEGMRNIGQCHQIGRGSTPPNGALAATWYIKAAEKGDLPSQGLLAEQLFNQGKDDEALVWLSKADAAGDLEATRMLGDYYYSPYNAKRDMNKAFGYFARAAEGGNTDAQRSYSYCFFSGRGTAKDGAEAYKWVVIAHKSGDKDAQPAINFLKPKLTAAEVAEGEKRADAWLASHKR